jgi:hypothetical protein
VLWFNHLRQDLIFAARGFSRDRQFTLSALVAILLAVAPRQQSLGLWTAACFGRSKGGDRLISVGEIMWTGARDLRVSPKRG